VFAGGVAGTLLRSALATALPASRFPLATFLTNVSGAFVLGALLEALGRSGPDTGPRRAARLGLGSGLLGAFTTYSTLAVESDLLVRGGHVGLAAAYAVGSVLAGLAAAAAGIAVAARAVRRSS
jgi:CrcB protein